MLLVSLSLLLSFIGVPVLARENYAPVFTPGHKRQLMTCEQTYGPSSLQCGGTDSRFCFDPSVGQTCCEKDSGYCKQGTYCAPVAGFCCIEGEDLSTCAQNAGFDLPNSASASAAMAPSTTSVPTVNRPVLTVTPFLHASSVPVAVQAEAPGCNFTAPAQPTLPAQTLVSNKTISPFVQVSVAVKGDQTLLGSLMIICIVGIFTTLV
ncbi:hypothetical protein F5X99DRAFT_406151 [Biscogniauxia marginata]|nr:hypothetical protein F5X99DRAFT_406151 [Biscogniauxia marginata]